MILLVTNSGVSVTRNFSVGLSNGSSNLVGVKIAAGLGVDKTQDITIGNEFRICLRIILRLGAVGVEPPLVVGIFVVVASNLLLI
jgi:hypothetical protein